MLNNAVKIDAPLVFLDQIYEEPERKDPISKKLRVIFDGTQFLGKIKKSKEASLREKYINCPAFDDYYSLALSAYNKLNRQQKRDIEKNGNKCKSAEFLELMIFQCYCDEGEIVDMKDIEKGVERKRQAMKNTASRMRRKMFLNKWTYFVTFTNGYYELEEEFKEKLLNYLRNKHERNGWRYMGIWERGSDTERLHLHIVLYVPPGEMPGNFEEKESYSFHKKKMQSRIENDEIAEKFGINDFQPLSEFEHANGPIADYMLKYCLKSGDKPFYGRGVPTYLEIEINDEIEALDLSVFKVPIHNDYGYIMLRDIKEKAKKGEIELVPRS